MQKTTNKFNYTIIRTAADEAAIELESVRGKIVSNIEYNIERYINNDWKFPKCTNKLFDANKPLFTLRANRKKPVLKFLLESKDIKTDAQKVDFLKHIKDEVENKIFDEDIINFIQEKE
ncbi:MAG: hypothetical protein PHE89_03845 [Alphaproteobacteria bacterium]|nr:hypothetical protein [Alphaproteobacteria bacterium]